LCKVVLPLNHCPGQTQASAVDVNLTCTIQPAFVTRRAVADCAFSVGGSFREGYNFSEARLKKDQKERSGECTDIHQNKRSSTPPSSGCLEGEGCSLESWTPARHTAHRLHGPNGHSA
jgi:hypothetical protein